MDKMPPLPPHPAHPRGLSQEDLPLLQQQQALSLRSHLASCKAQVTHLQVPAWARPCAHTTGVPAGEAGYALGEKGRQTSPAHCHPCLTNLISMPLHRPFPHLSTLPPLATCPPAQALEGQEVLALGSRTFSYICAILGELRVCVCMCVYVF